jgi:SagB-type dehydrogenase family enzyme
MSNAVWVLSPLALLLAYLIVRRLSGRALSRHLTGVVVSLALLVYFAITAGLGVFWVARQQLPVFEPHYLFGYAAVVLVTVHVAWNAPIVLRTFLGPPRRRGPRPVPALPRWLLFGLLLSAVGCGAFVAGKRYGATAPQRPPTAAQTTTQNADIVRWYHEISSESRVGTWTRAPALAWKKPPTYKEYPSSLPRVPLPAVTAPTPARPVDTAVIEGPHERREAIDVHDLSLLLHHSAGITHRRGGLDLRAAPSSGALFPAELYVAVRQVGGIEPGLYHYDPRGHALTRLSSSEPTDDALGHVSSAPATLVVSAVFARTGAKYGHRAYRYALADVGHLLENARVAAAERGLTAPMLSAFDDGAVAQTLSLDRSQEAPIAVMPLLLGPQPQESARNLVDVEKVSEDHPLGPTGQIHAATSMKWANAREPKAPTEGRVGLPARVPSGVSVWDAMASRRSVRNYAASPMTMQELGSLLSTMVEPGPQLSPHVEVWVIANRVDGLKAGSYRYDATSHGLEPGRRGDLAAATESAVLSQQMARQAAAVVVLTVRTSPVLEQGARAYRHAWLEVGMLGERAYLSAMGQGLGACAAGAFFDDEALALLGARDTWVAHFVTLGHP